MREPATQNRHGSSAALVIPIRVPATTVDVLPARRRRLDRDRPGGEVGRVVLELDAERLRELARARAEVARALAARGARACASSPSSGSSARISTAAPDALGLADRVEQRVDAVGAVHVGAARRPEQRRRARGQADERVAGGLGLVVGLGLDDHAGRVAVRDHAAEQRRGATSSTGRS